MLTEQLEKLEILSRGVRLVCEESKFGQLPVYRNWQFFTEKIIDVIEDRLKQFELFYH